MAYKVHFFKLSSGEIVRFAYHKMKRIGTKRKHCYHLITKSGKTYAALAPTGVISEDGEIKQDLEVLVLDSSETQAAHKVTIGFSNPSNRESYKELMIELNTIANPKLEGYAELKKLAEDHRRYAQHLANCKIRGVEPTKTAPPDYNEQAKIYQRAHLYIEAEKYQMSDIAEKQEAGRRALKILFEGSYAEVAKNILDNWAVLKRA